jgi:hypothetical protein
MHGGHQKLLDFQLERNVEITWWLLGVSGAYLQLIIKKMPSGCQPFFRIPAFL